MSRASYTEPGEGSFSYEVIVTEVEPSGKRIRLSRKAVFETEEKNQAREFAERQEQSATEGFGSLADKLRSAMKPKKD